MALRIGCDLDGVLADMEGALVREAEKLFGATTRARAGTTASPTTPRPWRTSCPSEVADNAPLQHELLLSDRERRALWRHVRSIDGFWESLEETEPGIVRKLAGLAADRRWEVIFLTRRPTTSGDTAQLQSQRWLVEKGFPLPSVYVVTASRGLIAAGLTLDIVDRRHTRELRRRRVGFEGADDRHLPQHGSRAAADPQEHGHPHGLDDFGLSRRPRGNRLQSEARRTGRDGAGAANAGHEAAGERVMRAAPAAPGGHMAQLAKALTALAAVAFVLAVVTNFTGDLLATSEGFSRASTNLALLAIAVLLGAGGSRP